MRVARDLGVLVGVVGLTATGAVMVNGTGAFVCVLAAGGVAAGLLLEVRRAALAAVVTILVTAVLDTWTSVDIGFSSETLALLWLLFLMITGIGVFVGQACRRAVLRARGGTGRNAIDR